MVDIISTVEDVQYCEGIHVLLRIFSTKEGGEYCQKIHLGLIYGPVFSKSTGSYFEQ